MDNSVGVGDGSEEPPGPDADGRIGGLFCQLHASRYTGELYIESGAEQLTIVFHGGNPVLGVGQARHLRFQEPNGRSGR